MFKALLANTTIVWFHKKYSYPSTPWKVNGNSEGEGGVSKAQIFKRKYEAKLKFQGVVQTKKLSMGEVWIFYATTHYALNLLLSKFPYISVLVGGASVYKYCPL